MKKSLTKSKNPSAPAQLASTDVSKEPPVGIVVPVNENPRTIPSALVDT